MDEETARRVYQTFNEVYRTGIPTEAFDWELIGKDGTRRILETSVSLMRDSKGRPLGFMVSDAISPSASKQKRYCGKVKKSIARRSEH